MHYSRWQKEIKRFPIQHQFEISPGGEVLSLQHLHLPAAWRPEGLALDRTVLSQLGPFYFRRLQQLSAGLIQIRQHPDRINFELNHTGWVILQFDPPQIEAGQSGGRSCYPIRGGFMHHPGGNEGGRFCFVIREIPDGLLLGIELRDYHPRIVGVGRGQRLRRFLYARSQAALHHLLSRDYLRRVAIALRSGTWNG